MSTFHTLIRALASTTVLAAALASQAAAQPSAGGSAESRYQQDRDACLAGQTQQSREVCMREAGAARDAARKGKLGQAAQGDHSANAVARCKVFAKADEKAACLDRIRGTANQSGSAMQGGVLRESVITAPSTTSTVTPAATAPAAVAR